MISPLPSSMVPYLGAGELPSSFVSRMAHLLGRNAYDFCMDVGLKFQAIADGNSENLSALAILGRSDPKVLNRFAYQRLDARRVVLNRHRFNSSSLARSRVRVCCGCIAEDMKNPSVPASVRPFQRAVWLLRDIQTCPIHEQALTDVTEGVRSAATHDFIAQLSPSLHGLYQRSSEIGARAPSSFETYAFARFHNDVQSPQNWLDQFSVEGASKICLIFGAMDIFGAKVGITSLTDHDRLKCQHRGFEITSGGEGGIRQILSELHKRRGVLLRSVGPSTHFSRLYAWLTRETEDTQYQPLRKIVADYCFDTFPGEISVLGFKVSKPKLHSVHTAAGEFGVSPSLLKKLLVLTGVLDPITKTLSDDHTIFDAINGERVIERYLHSLTATDAAEFLNIQRPLSDKLLGGTYLPQLVKGRPGWPMHPVFEKSMLEQFLRDILVDSSPISDTDTRLFSIVEASKRACCSAIEIIDLLISRKLRTVRNVETERGIQSLRVDLAEVRSHVRLIDHGGLSMREVEDELGTSTAVVKALVHSGILQGRTAINPVNRCPQTVVDRESLADFKSEYISLVCLAEEREIPFRRLKTKLSNIPPAFDPHQIGATFFRRSVLTN